MTSVVAILFCALLALKLCDAWSPGDTKPNIVYILADDLGFADVPWMDNDGVIRADNTKALAEAGIILNKFYAQPSCSPSRAAALTGLYPIHNGFNGGALGYKKKAGLESQYATLAERLKAMNYTNHMLGKWHLGWCKEEYFPHKRGFDSYLGIMHSGTTYSTYLTEDNAYDLWRDFQINRTYDGTYAADMYAEEAKRIISTHDQSSSPLFLYMAMQHIHTPLEPDTYITAFSGVQNTANINGKRKKGLAMIAALDWIVGETVAALNDAGMLDNTVIVYASDNGGQSKSGGASNWPLRGMKNTLWEGGIRVPSFVYSPLFDTSIVGETNDCLFHISDWFTTLLRMAGNTDDLGVDGLDQWDSLTSKGTNCQRTNLIHNIIDNGNGDYDAAYRDGDYKLILGDPGDDATSGWYMTNGTEVDGNDDADVYLYDLSSDPNEEKNLASTMTDKVAEMTAVIESAAAGIVSFSTGGQCSEAECIQNGEFVSGCCA